jgi:electron transfer flavoprotein alpha/beta subunit
VTARAGAKRAPTEATSAQPAGASPLGRVRVLVAVTGAFFGALRVRRSSGELDTEGLERILSEPSVRALTVAKQLQATGAELVAVHVDKGAGEDVLREALAHGVDQAILVQGAASDSDASTRAATIADAYEKHGPFDAIIGPARSSFGGFSGALAGVAGRLGLPCFIGVKGVAIEGDRFRIQYHSIFGDYDLRVPRPCILLAGDVPPSHPTAWGIREAFDTRGLLRVQADQYVAQEPLTRRVRIEAVRAPTRSVEDVDGATLVRRLRSRALIAEKPATEET